MNTTPFRRILRENIYIIAGLIIVSIAIYYNSLSNEFAVVDDLFGYVENENIKDFWGSIRTFNIQSIMYAIVYKLAGINPFPLRLFAIINHSIVTILVFLTTHTLFGRKTAIISAFLFTVHPVNTEAIDWISANFYIVMAVFMYVAILFYLSWRRTKNMNYLYGTIVVFALFVLFFRNPWVLIIPPVICVIDFFILNHGFDKKFYTRFLLMLAPILLLYFIFTFTSDFQKRTNVNQEDNKILVNEQAIIPIIESYPYSIYNMFRLYIFPKDLTVYYDGNPVTSATKVLMFITFFLYILALIVSINRNKKVLGLLLLVPICIAPVFSPIKVTWYITERYLYFGTGFFTILLALLLLWIEKKYSLKHAAYGIAIVIFILFSCRTFIRNTDWKNPVTLGNATIRTSPKSVRPYNDIGGYYIMNKRFDEGKEYYKKALKISPSIVAMNNLGYLYILYGLDPTVHTMDQSYENLVKLGLEMLSQKQDRMAMYYFNEAYRVNSNDPGLLNQIAMIYSSANQYTHAHTYLDASFKMKPTPDYYFISGYLAFKEGKIDESIQHLNTVLTMDPNHQGAKANLDYILNQRPTTNN